MLITLLRLTAIALALQVTAADPALQVHERRTPQDVVVERHTFYVKDGIQIQHGKDEWFDERGRLRGSVMYRHGKRHGKMVTYFDGIGTKSSELNYENDCQDGISRYWSPTGELLFKCEYRDKKPWNGRPWMNASNLVGSTTTTVSIATRFYKDGKVVAGSQRTFTFTYQHRSPDDPPDVRTFVRWKWYPYEIDSNYPFLDRLPDFDQVPFLIDWCANKRDSSEVAFSQLVALTRVNFGEMRSEDESTRQIEIQRWRRWWQDVGLERSKLTMGKGIRDLKAWGIVLKGRSVDLPKSPVSLPDEYVLELRFRSGDYSGIVKESTILTRKGESASLVREFSTRTGGATTKQSWLPFTRSDADRIVRAIGYLVDNPWLINDQSEIERQFWEEQTENNGEFESLFKFQNEPLTGRESFSMYYPSASYTLKDGDGKIWWNDDPVHWHGGGEIRHRFVAHPVRSCIYPFVALQFPESARFGGTSKPGWKEIEPQDGGPKRKVDE